MRFVNIYLVGRVLFCLGIALALGKLGVFAHIQPVWIGIGVVLALGIGIMLSVSSGKPAVTRED